jgi:FkbM family methyltransferase
LIAGAHMGYLVLLSALHTKGRVHAFEPIPELFKKSEDNLNLNPELRVHITLTQAALGEDKGEVTMYSEDIRSSVIPYGGGHVANQNKVIVPVTTIDDYCRKTGVEKLDLVLLDIEGFEWFALNGANKVLKSLPILILEISKKILSKTTVTPEMMFGHLANLGYKISFIDDSTKDGQTVEYGEQTASKFLEREYVNILAIPANAQ